MKLQSNFRRKEKSFKYSCRRINMIYHMYTPYVINVCVRNMYIQKLYFFKGLQISLCKYLIYVCIICILYKNYNFFKSSNLHIFQNRQLCLTKYNACCTNFGLFWSYRVYMYFLHFSNNIYYIMHIYIYYISTT